MHFLNPRRPFRIDADVDIVRFQYFAYRAAFATGERDDAHVALVGGVLGSAGHYCLTRSFAAADISATQSAKFLDLVWSALMGWLLFADLPSQSTLAGGLVICAATIWVARRESRAT